MSNLDDKVSWAELAWLRCSRVNGGETYNNVIHKIFLDWAATGLKTKMSPPTAPTSVPMEFRRVQGCGQRTVGMYVVLKCALKEATRADYTCTRTDYPSDD